MIESPRHKKGDVVRFGLDFRICVCADEMTAVFLHCNRAGEAVRLYDALIIHPIHGRYEIPFKKVTKKDGATLSMKLNR